MAAPNSFSWKASSHIHHDKSPIWIAAVAACVLVVAIGIYFLSGGDYWSPLVVLVFGLAVLLYGVKSPDEATCSVSSNELKIDDKVYSLDDFAGFSIKNIGGVYEIDFVPAKRTSLPVTINCNEEEIEQIVALLEPTLPLHEARFGWVEQAMHRIRF